MMTFGRLLLVSLSRHAITSSWSHLSTTVRSPSRLSFGTPVNSPPWGTRVAKPESVSEVRGVGKTGATSSSVFQFHDRSKARRLSR